MPPMIDLWGSTRPSELFMETISLLCSWVESLYNGLRHRDRQ